MMSLKDAADMLESGVRVPFQEFLPLIRKLSVGGPAEGFRVDGGSCPVMFDSDALGRFVRLCESDRTRECGAFLIGNVYTDRITGRMVAIVSDIYTRGDFGDRDSYRFTGDVQSECVSYVSRRHGDRMHVVGTVHSHGLHPCFFSETDFAMMDGMGTDQVHMVVSPSHREYSLLVRDSDGGYRRDAVLAPDTLGDVFGYSAREVRM